jgi:pro-sigmaK processing inhibitor BofA
MAIDMSSSLLSEIVIVVIALLIVYVIFKVGKAIMALLANVILGFISLFVLNTFLSIGIPYNIITIVITALLGVVGVVILVILRLLGITI